MKQFLILFRLILNKNSSRLYRGLIGYLILLLPATVFAALNLPGSTLLQYFLLFYPFIYTWYLCSTLDVRYFNVYILPRAIDRGLFFSACFCTLMVGLISLLPIAFLLVISHDGFASPMATITKSLLLFYLLGLDYLLLTSLSYCFCILDFPLFSFLGALLPALLVFKSDRIIAALQVNYCFPLAISSLSDLQELYTFCGGLLHSLENIICSLAFLWICRYFYKNKDIST